MPTFSESGGSWDHEISIMYSVIMRLMRNEMMLWADHVNAEVIALVQNDVWEAGTSQLLGLIIVIDDE